MPFDLSKIAARIRTVTIDGVGDVVVREPTLGELLDAATGPGEELLRSLPGHGARDDSEQELAAFRRGHLRPCDAERHGHPLLRA